MKKYIYKFTAVILAIIFICSTVSFACSAKHTHIYCNTGKYFNTVDEAIAYYYEQVGVWETKLNNNLITYEQFHNNTPSGYQPILCDCGKVGIEFFYNHIHEYKFKLVKATAKRNGYTCQACSCGDEKNKQPIYMVKSAVLSGTNYEYSGKVVTPSVTVKDSKGKVLKKGTDYKVTCQKGRKNIGKYALKISFIGNYAGSMTRYFNITPKVTLSKSKFVYNGKTQTPAVIVKNAKGNKLKQGRDYTVALSKGRKAVGTYSAVITFNGKYSGKITEKYTIVPKGTSLKAVNEGIDSLKVYWKAQSAQTTGYQIHYSTDKNFAKDKTKVLAVAKNTQTAVTLKALGSGKTYYVRMRTYKTVKGVNYFSAYSKPVKQTTHEHIYCNTGKYFNTVDEAIAYYYEQSRLWENKLNSGTITYEEFLKNEPSGYQPILCDCGKVGIEFFYR